jgi:hypothetical protein
MQITRQGYKPNSVLKDFSRSHDHSSSPTVSRLIQLPTRMSDGAGHAFIPIWNCSMWGLPGLPIAGQPVRFYRTFSPLPA